MKIATHQIERIVRDVLAEMSVVPNGDLPVEQPHTQGNSAGDELVVHCRVVTLSELEGRLGGVRRLVVPPRAVVTPAARDELLQKNIVLVCGGSETSGPAARLRLVTAVAARQFDPAPLLTTLNCEAISVEQHAFDCLIAATDRLADELATPDTLGLLLTKHTAAGLCLANRHQGVRAVLGHDPAAVAADADDVGANLLVVDPTAATGFRLNQVVGRFCRGGIRPCPDALRDRLTYT